MTPTERLVTLVAVLFTIGCKATADTTSPDAASLDANATDAGARVSCAPAPTSSLLANVKDAAYGAKGDGITNDTLSIQKAIDAVAGTGGTVLVPDGTFMIDALTVPTGGAHGLVLKSDMTLKLSASAVLKAFPNGATGYHILWAYDANGLNIEGGTIEGDRVGHTGSTGESGMGISILNSQNVVVDSVTSKDCWGDGFYVSGLATKNVTFCNVTADHNRRQGMSIVEADGVVIKDSTFKDTTGTAPEAGIDIEPNLGQTVNDVLIQNSAFINNAGGGFQTGVPYVHTGQATASLIVFDGNWLTGNGVNPAGGGYRFTIQVTNSDGTKITNNVLEDNAGQGIRLTGDATNTGVIGNRVQGTKLVTGNEYWTGVGILISTAAYSTVTENTVTANAGHGIWQIVADTTVNITGNTVSGNALTP